MKLRLMLKISFLPWIRSSTLQSLIAVSIAQLLLGAWLGGAIVQEIRRTKKFANDAKWITVQTKEDRSKEIKEIIKDFSVSFEELSTDDVLNRMEPEEPEVVQTVKSMGAEGLQLIPKVVLLKGLLPDTEIEKIKILPGIARIDVSPVHHHRLQSFYQHLQLEMRIAVGMILFLMMVLLLSLQRIQVRDLKEVKENLLTWGASHLQSRLPLFFSLIGMTLIGGILSVAEWFSFKKWIWKSNPFLGELSIDRSLHFPVLAFFSVSIALFLFICILSFSGKQAEE